MVSVLLPTMVPLHGILCHSCSDINRNLIASSGLWKLICFLWINVTIMFSMLLCYYVLLFMFFSLCFVRFMGHVGLCSTKCSWDVLPGALCSAFLYFRYYIHFNHCAYLTTMFAFLNVHKYYVLYIHIFNVPILLCLLWLLYWCVLHICELIYLVRLLFIIIVIIIIIIIIIIVMNHVKRSEPLRWSAILNAHNYY